MTRALVLREFGGALEMVERPEAEPGADDVVVAVRAAGICHSDAPMIATDSGLNRNCRFLTLMMFSRLVLLLLSYRRRPCIAAEDLTNGGKTAGKASFPLQVTGHCGRLMQVKSSRTIA